VIVQEKTLNSKEKLKFGVSEQEPHYHVVNSFELTLKFFDYVFTINTPKLPFLAQIPNF